MAFHKRPEIRGHITYLRMIEGFKDDGSRLVLQNVGPEIRGHITYLRMIGGFKDDGNRLGLQNVGPERR